MAVVQTIYPNKIAGTLMAPPAKSVMQRACAAALIRGGRTIVHNYGSANDDKVALGIIEKFGAQWEQLDQQRLQITSRGIDSLLQAAPEPLYFGESGLSLRLFTPLAAMAGQRRTLEGSGSLLQRPVGFFEEVLPDLGVEVRSKSGYLPLTIEGTLMPKTIRINGALSSQYLTGLLFAYAAAAASGVHIFVDQLNSKPYIDLSLQVLADFGLAVPQHQDYRDFYFPEQVSRPKTAALFHYQVEGDWSGAAFLLVAGAISGSVTLKGLNAFSVQADRKILEALQDSTCSLSIQSEEITVRRPKELRAFQFNAVDCPDLFPPLVVLAACCSGTSVIEGVHRLQHKESNRAQTLQKELGKLGLNIALQDDMMLVQGTALHSGNVQSHNDHRIAMALAIAALRADGPVTIDGAAAVAKSYPHFFHDLHSLCQATG